jgi:hypothetical protein
MVIKFTSSGTWDRLCGLVVRVLSAERRCNVFPVRYELNLYVMEKKVDRLCSLVARVPGYTTRCIVFPVRYELNLYICYGEESRPPLWYSGQSSWLQNGDVMCFLWGTNWIYICYAEESRPPLWSSGQSSWLQIQRSGFDSRCYQTSWEAVGLEWGQLSLVSTIEELLGRKISGSGPENLRILP